MVLYAKGTEFLVNSTTANHQQQPTITELSDGGFVICWIAPDGSSDGIFGQRYDASGAKVGGEFYVSGAIHRDQDSPSITALSDGGLSSAG